MKLCPVCASSVPFFLPLSPDYKRDLEERRCLFKLDEFETLNHAEYECPTCGASDRDRLMALYFLRCLVEDGWAGMLRVLEVAPALPLRPLLNEYAASYRSADLASPLADDKVDITDMRIYADESFDLVLCSHVLEHVVNDAAAMHELARVLAPGGRALLLVPIPLNLEVTDEWSPGEPIPDDAERVRRFGQADHVRMYSKSDFLNRVSATGLRVQLVGNEGFPDDDFSMMGLSKTACLYVAHKAI